MTALEQTISPERPSAPLLQPDNHNKKYEALFVEIDTGQIKIPIFQREFVWDKEQSSKLIDSILKGFPIGTFTMRIISRRRRSLIATTLINLTVLMVLAAAQLFDFARANERSESIVRAYNRTGFDLFAKLAAEPGNRVISPYSIGTAMAMVVVGARGETEHEMMRVLNFGNISPATIAESNKRLNETVAKRTPDEEGSKIVVANALHITGDPVSRSYQELLTEKFTAELFGRSDLGTINAWIKQKTEGKIDTILDRLNPNSIFVILNAIYFKSNWAAQFDEENTVLRGNFHLSESETIQVPMMHHRGPYRILNNSAFEAIELPYKGEKLIMVALLPRQQLAEPGRVAIDISDETAKDVIDRLRGVQPTKVHLSMPKFKTESTTDLKPSFEKLGLERAFGQADFSGVEEGAKIGDLWISQIQHTTFIDVNEAGTEAGASAAVETVTKERVPAVEINHPFLYMIADTTTGAILFIGRLSDPRKSGPADGRVDR